MRLRLVRFLIYGGLVAVTATICAPRWQVYWLITTYPATYFPFLPPLWLWLPLGLATVAFAAWLSWSLVSGAKIPLWASVSMVVVAVVAVSVSAWQARSPRPKDKQVWTSYHGAPPDLQLQYVMNRIWSELQRSARGSKKRLPTTAAALRRHLVVKGRKIVPNYRYRWRRRRYRIVVRTGQEEPVTVAGQGHLPGTIYFAVDKERRRFWITGLGLGFRKWGSPRLVEKGGMPWVLVGRLRR